MQAAATFTLELHFFKTDLYSQIVTWLC